MAEPMKLDGTDVKKISKEAIWGTISTVALGALAVIAKAITEDEALADNIASVIKGIMPVGFGAVGVKLFFYFLRRLLKNHPPGD